jgi:pyridoxamine 5'-phosphate oxidase
LEIGPTVESEPIARLRALLGEAIATGMPDPNAMVMATAGPGGQPSSRVVLLKDFDERGFVFYTNLGSRKAVEILANPLVSLSFFWRPLDRQATVLGRAEAVADAEADEYFASRPRGSQIGAWASRQSRPLASREELLAELARVDALYAGKPVPRPRHWSGFRVVPSSIELWTAGADRLHHRELYERTAAGGWRKSLLYP